MANGNRSVVVGRISGSIGDELTFRNAPSGSVVSKKVRTYGKPFTDDQKSVQLKFKKCAAYAVYAINDPVLRPIYEAAARKGKSAYNVAHQDAYTPPVIDSVSYALYSGEIGSSLGIDITNVVSVASVKVKIYKADGTLLEAGDAVPFMAAWQYVATADNDIVAGSMVVVTAIDLARNVQTDEFELV